MMWLPKKTYPSKGRGGSEVIRMKRSVDGLQPGASDGVCGPTLAQAWCRRTAFSRGLAPQTCGTDTGVSANAAPRALRRTEGRQPRRG